MVQAPRENMFEREGIPLQQWLLDLASLDPELRQKSGDAITAMYLGSPSFDSGIEDLIIDKSDGEDHQAAWRAAVEDAVNAPGFPRRSFFMSAAARLIGAHEKYMSELGKVDEQYEQICERLGERLQAAASEEQRQNHLRRLGRALCAAIARDGEKKSEVSEVFSSANMALSFVISAAPTSMIEVPEALWMLIESKQHAHLAYEVLEKVGPASAPLFLDHLVKKTRSRGFHGLKALASVGRGNPEVIGILLEGFKNWPVQGYWNAAQTLHEMGSSARKHDQVIPILLQLSESPEGPRRAAAAYALGGVARGIDDAIGRLLEMTYDEYEYTDYRGHEVAGCAITALGEIGRQPDRIIPRLLEMFDTFEEFDVDRGYGGSHARLCEALKSFGTAASSAIPVLIRTLECSLTKNADDWWDGDILNLLGSLGPAAIEAIPVLEKLDKAYEQYSHQEESEWEEEDDEDDDESEYEDTLDESEEESEYRETIRRIRGY